MVTILFWLIIFLFAVLTWCALEMEKKDKEILRLRKPETKTVNVVHVKIPPETICVDFEIPDDEINQTRLTEQELVNRYVERALHRIIDDIYKLDYLHGGKLVYFKKNKDYAYRNGCLSHLCRVQIKLFPQHENIT